MRALMAFVRKHGKIYPCYRTPAHMLRKDPETIVEAMKRLIRHGWATKHRWSKIIKTPNGDRRVGTAQQGCRSSGLVARRIALCYPTGSRGRIHEKLRLSGAWPWAARPNDDGAGRLAEP
jgi:hypothetical protein